MHNFCRKIADEVQIISHIQYQTCVKNFNCLMRNNGSLVGHVTATINARWHEEEGLYLSSQRNLILNNIIEIL